MVIHRVKKGITDNPKKLANLIDLVNLPSNLREFVGQSQISRLGCFMRVWSYIKANNLQDPHNKNMVNCDEKLKSIFSGRQEVDLAELPDLIKLHFPKKPKVFLHSRKVCKTTQALFGIIWLVSLGMVRLASVAYGFTMFSTSSVELLA